VLNSVPGIGNPNAKLMIVSDFPGQSDVTKQCPLSDAGGMTLDSIFSELGHEGWRGEFYTTYVYKSRPPGNILKRIKEVCNPKEEIEALWNEIDFIKPNVILTLGDLALSTLTGHEKANIYRGSILTTSIGTPKVVCAIHPSKISRASNDSGDYDEEKKTLPYIYRTILKLDIERALNESLTSRLQLPQRSLLIARSSVDVYRFFNRNKGRKPYADIETFQSTVPSCLAIAFDEHEALSIPLFQKLGDVVLTTQPHGDLAHTWALIDELLRTQETGWQNGKFDQLKLELLGFKLKGIFTDTMLKAHTVNPEMPSFSQAFLTSVYTREPYYKDEGKEFSYGRHKIDRLFLYNAKDPAICAEIDRKLNEELIELSAQYKTDLVAFYNNYVNKQHQFYYDMEKVGFAVDEFQRQFLIDKYEGWSDSLQIQLNVLAGRTINVNSPKQVSELVYEQLGIEPAKKWNSKKGCYAEDRSTNEDTIAELLKSKVTDEYRKSILNTFLTKRRVDKTLGTYLYANTDYDSRMRSTWRIIGTENGRSSTRTIDEPTRPYSQGFAFQTLTKHGDIGQDIRSIFIADPGFVFVNIDLSQAEARVVALLSEDYELLEAFNHIDLHRRMAACALITGKLNLSYEFDPIADILGKDSSERFLGKKAKHATNYDMKWKRFISEVHADAKRFHIELTISPFKAKQIIERIHAATPKTKQVFHAQIQERMNSQRALVSASGRLRRFFGRMSDQLYQESYAFIPQDTVKYRLTRSGLDIMDLKYPIRCVGEAHDALTFLMPINEYKDICKEIKPLMEAPIDFSGCSLPRKSITIPVDFEVGENYKELEKLK
jgi:uracil-DNA glycosylase family 4